MSPSYKNNILFRLLKTTVFFTSVLFGTELAFWRWEVQKSQTQKLMYQNSGWFWLLEILSQMGYAQILENTRGRLSRAKFGPGRQRNVHGLSILNENIDRITGQAHEVVVMTGHNDCQYFIICPTLCSEFRRTVVV